MICSCYEMGALMTISQKKLADEFQVTQPSVLSWLRMAGLDSARLRDPETALAAVALGELTRLGLPGPQAARLVGECRSELVHCSVNGVSAWSVIFRPWRETPDATVATTPAQLADIAAAQPLTLVVALPALVAAAKATLARLEACFA